MSTLSSGTSLSLATTSTPGPQDRPRLRERVGGLLIERVVLGLIVILLVLVAAFPQLFTAYDPYAQVGDPFAGPSAQHPFGTDDIGRDLYTRVVHGAGISLSAAVLAIIIGVVGGLVLGLLAGLHQGSLLDGAISRLSEAVLAVPGVLLAMAVIAAFGRGAIVVAIAVGVGQVPFFARLIRGQVIRTTVLTFVEAAETSGSTRLRTVVVHIVPAIARPLVSYTILHLALVMLEIGGISYLGFGEPPPSPEWGALIAAGQRYISYAWWIALIPGLAFVFVVVVLNRLSTVIGGRR